MNIDRLIPCICCLETNVNVSVVLGCIQSEILISIYQEITIIFIVGVAISVAVNTSVGTDVIIVFWDFCTFSNTLIVTVVFYDGIICFIILFANVVWRDNCRDNRLTVENLRKSIVALPAYFCAA